MLTENSKTKGKTLIEIVEIEAADRPSKTAIQVGNRSITYAELSARAGQICAVLRATGTPRRPVVAVLTEDKAALIAAILGILQADGIFVPLDPRYPVHRLQTMLSTARPDVLIMQRELTSIGSAAAPPSCLQWLLDELEGRKKMPRRDGIDARTENSAPSARPTNLPDDVGYIYFTSGSTGAPKAIAGSLNGLLHFIRWEADALYASESIRVSQLTPPSFDPFLRDVFLPLSLGGTLCIPPDWETILDARKLIDWIDDAAVTVIHATPSLFRAILNQAPSRSQFPSLRYVVLAGETLFPEDVRKWSSIFGERIQLLNLYGPTETTLAKFFHFVSPSYTEGHTVPVGKPIPGTEVLLLNEALRPCSPGTPGEVCIRTRFRSHGYYGQPDLSREKFVRNPCNPDDAEDLVYRSGDLGRLLPNGDLELLGRRDHQVKIRGVRIELEEVEKFLRAHPEVADCAVKDWEDEQRNKYLCAYIVPRSAINLITLRDYLLQWLPETTVPSVFLKLEALPLNLNGKTNRSELPDPRDSGRSGDTTAPRTELEHQLAAIWKSVLRLPRIGIHDSFFSLGSDSLMAMRALANMRRELRCEIPLRFLFEYQTIALLAARLQPELMLAAERDYPPKAVATAH